LRGKEKIGEARTREEIKKRLAKQRRGRIGYGSNYRII